MLDQDAIHQREWAGSGGTIEKRPDDLPAGGDKLGFPCLLPV